MGAAAEKLPHVVAGRGERVLHVAVRVPRQRRERQVQLDHAGRRQPRVDPLRERLVRRPLGVAVAEDRVLDAGERARREFIQRDGPMWRSLCEVLRGAGLPEAEVEKVGAVLAALVGGLLLTEVNGTMRRLIGADDAEDTGFALAVWLLIDGVAARV